MKIALIKNNKVENVAVFESVQAAQQLMPGYICIESNIAEIDDTYDGSVIIKSNGRLPTKMSKFRFISLFTTAEMVAIYNKADTDKVVVTFLKKLEASELVDYATPDIAVGLNYLVSVGCITSQRKAEILAV